MSRMDLLDPRASDRFLRAYALLASEYAAGAKSAVDSLLPFVKRAVEAYAGRQFDAREVSKYVEETYRVRAPIYMVDAFKHKLLESGHLERPANANGVLICKSRLDDDAESAVTQVLSTDDLRIFEQALTAFANNLGLEKPYASENWSEAIIKFFAGWEGQKAATVSRQLILDSKRLDNRVVSGFIGALDQSSANYQIAKKLYYGVIVADFFTCIAEVSTTDSLQNVAVVLDTTLLMRLLGTSGSLLKEATGEMIRDIQQLRGNTYYFSHTYEELIESLEALAYQIESRGEMNRESAHALAAGETSLARIQGYVREADVRLGESSITQHEVQYDRQENVYQIDEEEFVRLIGGARFQEHRVRWERDAKSLALIVRLRRGGRTRNLRDCKAIFVTHNGALARDARHFLDFSSFDVPPILTTDQVSVLAWLERGGGINDKELSAKLAAACYEAVIPREGWEAQFWEKVEELKQNDEYRDLLGSQVLTHAMRSTILDKTFGEPSLARQLDLGPILKDLAERAKVEKENDRRQGQEEGRKGALADLDLRLQRRAAAFSRVATKAVLGILFFVVLGLYLVPAVRLAINPDEKGIYYFLNLVFAFCLSVVTLLALFGVTPTIRKPMTALEALLSRLVVKILRSLT